MYNYSKKIEYDLICLDFEFEFYLNEILECRLRIGNDNNIAMTVLLSVIWPNQYLNISHNERSYHSYIDGLGNLCVTYLTKPTKYKTYIKANDLYNIYLKSKFLNTNIDNVQTLEF